MVWCLVSLSSTFTNFLGKYLSLIEKQCSFLKQNWLAASTNFRDSYLLFIISNNETGSYRSLS